MCWSTKLCIDYSVLIISIQISIFNEKKCPKLKFGLFFSAQNAFLAIGVHSLFTIGGIANGFFNMQEIEKGRAYESL